MLVNIIILFFFIIEVIAQPPNIVLILADDLGFDDVGFHGSTQIPTPKIDQLASQGIIFNRFYAQSLCTPSRAALMTAKYPFRIGMQADPIKNGEPWGLPLTETIMPQYFKELGYSTHIIGKWHLGEHRKAFFPSNRGFDTFLGTPSGTMDYYKYDFRGGYTLYNGTSVLRLRESKYITDLFADWAEELITTQKDGPFFLYLPLTAPRAGGGEHNYLSVPERYLDNPKIRSISDEFRRNYTAMIASMDDFVGRIHQSLVRQGIANNTLLWFLSDNGGPIAQHGTYTPVAPTSNWPLRGCKRTGFEGGVRVVSFLWAVPEILNTTGRVSQQLMHITDLLPTLIAAAMYGNNSSRPTDDKMHDGFNQWDWLRRGELEKSPRNEIVLDLFNEQERFAFLSERYKIVKGNFFNGAQEANKWTRPRGTSDQSPMRESGPAVIDCGFERMVERSPCLADRAVCLFDLKTDPCELNNLADQLPEKIEGLLRQLSVYNRSSVKPLTQPFDPKSKPVLHGGVWAPWLDSD